MPELLQSSKLCAILNAKCFKTQTLAFTRRQTTLRLNQIVRQITDIDAEMQTRLDACPNRARARAILRSIPGIGAVTAAAILIECREFGTLTGKQIASLAGLAPMTRQSGTWRGKAFGGEMIPRIISCSAALQGGRKHLRDALSMPALTARFNPDLKAKYQAMIAAGKPPKIALIALMRKLIELANALVQNDRNWRPKEA